MVKIAPCGLSHYEITRERCGTWRRDFPDTLWTPTGRPSVSSRPDGTTRTPPFCAEPKTSFSNRVPRQTPDLR